MIVKIYFSTTPFIIILAQLLKDPKSVLSHNMLRLFIYNSCLTLFKNKIRRELENTINVLQ